MGSDFFRRTGLLPGTAFVVASNAPAATIRQARILKARYGNLIQICDGVNDQVEIQAAIDALSAGRTWKEKVALEGDFEISAAIEIPSFTVLDLTDARMKLANGTNGAMWVVTNKTDVDIIGGIYDGNKANQIGGTVLNVIRNGSERITFQGMTTHDTWGCGIYVGDSKQVLIRGNNIKDSGQVCGIYVEATPLVGFGVLRDIQILDNYIENCNDACIQIGGHGYSVTKILVANNILQQPRTADYKGIAVYADSIGVGGVQEVNIVNNIIQFASKPDATLPGLFGIGLYVSTTDAKFTIIGNQIKWAEDGILFGGFVGGAIIKGNNIEECWDGSMRLDGTNDSLIEGNICHIALNSGGACNAIYLSNCDRNLVVGNKIYDDQVAPTMKYGIYEDNSSDYNLLTGNSIIATSLTKGMNIVGANTIVRGNLGYVTENSGTATIVAGATSIVVAHGLAATPTRVILTPTTDTAGRRPWVSAKAAANFTITIDSLYAADIIFDWKAQVGEG